MATEMKTLLKKELEEAGLYLDEKTIEILIPTYEQLCNYVRESRLVTIDDEEPAHVFTLNTGGKT